MGSFALPLTGRVIAADELLAPAQLKQKQDLADAALSAAKKAGATYADARIGRYLNQFVVTREMKVQNIVEHGVRRRWCPGYCQRNLGLCCNQ